jgi:hypothetical protein
MKSGERRLQFFVKSLEISEQPLTVLTLFSILVFGENSVDLLIRLTHLFDEPAQILEISFAIVGKLVDDDTVKPLFGRHRQQFLSNGEMFFGGEAKAVNKLPRLTFGIFDLLANFNLLLSGQQWNFSHLLQVHSDGIIKILVANRLLIIVSLILLALFQFGGIDNIDLHRAQFAVNLVQVRRGDHMVRQGIVDIVVSQMSLLLG